MRSRSAKLLFACILSFSLAFQLPLSAMAEGPSPDRVGGVEDAAIHTEVAVPEKPEVVPAAPPDADAPAADEMPADKALPARSGSIASANGESFETLQAAIDAAQAGDTVVLSGNHAELITIAKAITLDLGGHTLSAPEGSESPTITVKDECVPTIKNGTISGTETRYVTAPSAIEGASAAFNLEDISLVNCSGPGNAMTVSAYSDLGVNVHFTNVTADGLKCHVIWGNLHNDVTFANCRFENNEPTGHNRLVVIGGIGRKSFIDCTFLNNKAQGIVDTVGAYTRCRFENNGCQDGATVAGNEITLVDTVVKNNSCTNEYGVAGVDAKEEWGHAPRLTLTNSAVYNNSNSEGGNTDFGDDCMSSVDATKMKDPTDPAMDFSGYGIDRRGTVRVATSAFEAQVGETKYEKLTEAVEAALDGDTIQIISTDGFGDPEPISVKTLWIQKKLTIDLNGRDVTSDGWSFCVAGSEGELSLVNTAARESDVSGAVFCFDDACSLSVEKNISFSSSIYYNSHTVINGTHKSLRLVCGETLNEGKSVPVTFGEDFAYLGNDYSLVFDLPESVEDLNDPGKQMDDITIAHGATSGIADKVSIGGVNNPLVDVQFRAVTRSGETGDLVVHKELASIIYLNGTNGNDNKDGLTKETAVKSFEKAKELAEGLVKDDESVLIYVTGTIKLDSEAMWELSKPNQVTLMREADFRGNLVELGSGAKLTLQDIVIDGNRQHAAAGDGSLIKVSGGELNLLEGSVLQNNRMTDMAAYPPVSGGAVHAEKNATVNLVGGIVRGNTAVWGGGIFVTNSTLNIKSGLVTENHAVWSDDKTDGADGGGIASWYRSKVNIAGGEITNNTAASNGGGLSLGVRRVTDNGSYSELHMTGGTFDGNVANDSGGGLFVQGGIGEGYSRAHVSGGYFTNNIAREGFFGGGGIYVNGGHNWPGFHSAELYLTNALVTGNDARQNGGGYAACPTSKTEIRLKNGAAFYGNDAPSGREVHINASVVWHGGMSHPDYEISPSMLGGAPYKWTYGDPEEEQFGEEVPLSHLAGTLYGEELNLSNDVTEETAAPARDLAKVFIMGNHAGVRGGGIGSNGDVYIGTSELTELTVLKKWVDNNNAAKKRPESIKFEVYRQLDGSDDEPTYVGFDTIKPDNDGNWSKTIKNLPRKDGDDRPFVYTVKEVFDENASVPYLSVSTGRVSGAGGTATITNTYETISIPGMKTWSDGEDQDGLRPKSITIHLLANGKEVASRNVTADDNWLWEFEDLPKYSNGEAIKYTIYEDEVEGYIATVTGDQVQGFTIKNSHTPKPNNPPVPHVEKPRGCSPQTGDPSGIASACGLLGGSVSLMGAALWLRGVRRKRS